MDDLNFVLNIKVVGEWIRFPMMYDKLELDVPNKSYDKYTKLYLFRVHNREGKEWSKLAICKLTKLNKEKKGFGNLIEIIKRKCGGVKEGLQFGDMWLR